MLYGPALAGWPDHLDKSTVKQAMPSSDAPLELTRIMAVARSRAFQALKLEQDEKLRQKKLRGENIDITEENTDQYREEAADSVDPDEAAQYSSGSEDDAEMDSINGEDVESDQQDVQDLDSQEDEDDEEVD